MQRTKEVKLWKEVEFRNAVDLFFFSKAEERNLAQVEIKY